MRRLLLLSLMMAVSVLVFAQTRTITGSVIDETGAPVSFASITEKGTTNGVSADESGNFSINARTGAVLVVSATGYSTKEVTVSSSAPLNVVLTKGDAQVIEEVVVTAYGTQTKQSITGSIETIKADDIQKIQTSNVMQSLSGKVTGVQIKSPSGQPGDAPSLRFRGIGSISSSNAPLYVVDGVPFNGDVSAISSQDIESISFLKDASANALYGSRGANGVVIITTKKGKAGLMSLTYDTKLGINSRAVPEYKLITDPKEYYELRWQRLRLGAKLTTPTLTWDAAGAAATNGLVKDLGYNIFNVANNQIVDATTGKINPAASLLYQDDWYNALFKNSFRQEHFVSIAYGTDKLSSYLSGGYLNDEGYVLNSGFNRISARANLDYKVFDFLKIGSNINFASTKAKVPQAGKGSGTYSNLFSWTRNMAPIYPIYARDKSGAIQKDANGEDMYDFGSGETINPDGTAAKRTYITNMNPYATTLKNIQTNENKNLSMRNYISLDFLKYFNFVYNLGYDYYATNRLRYGWEKGGDAQPYGGSIDNATSVEGTITHQQLLTFQKNINDHSLNIMVGHESSNYTAKMLAGGKTNVVISDNIIISNASKYSYLNGYNDNYKVEGYLSKLNYNFKNKYFLNGSFRRDGSSVFHPDNRWGNFYGLGVAWSVNQEDFLKGNSAITNLKLKASYGEQGNDYLFYPSYVSMNHRSFFGFSRNYMPYVTQYDITADAQGNPTIREAYLGNKDLKWEVSKNLNAGFELSLFNRVNIQAEFFRRAVSDMLYNFPLPPSSGSPSISRNVGDMQNTGFEVSIDGDVVKTGDWTINLWGNLTHYKSKITKLPDPFADGIFRFVEGKSPYTYYLREFIGVDKETGEAKWNKGDVDKKTGEATGPKTETKTHSAATLYLSDKTANPDFYGGFGLNMQYKKLSFSTGFAYQMGGYVYDGLYQGFFSEGTGMGSSGHNYHKDVYNTWTPENKEALLPMLSSVNKTQYGASDLFLISASYISWENFAFSYDITGDYLSKIKMKNARISILGNNLWLWSKRMGLDPRMTQLGAQFNNGATLNNYSLLRSLSLGITLKF